MTPARFKQITSRYSSLRIGVIGDFCLDRYFEIDPNRAEISIETGLPVHNVVRTRCQPGAAGTILNNLAALGAAELWPIGISGDDGEGWSLVQAMRRISGVQLKGWVNTSDRCTFTYSKPLIRHRERPPEELSRLDTKNWTPTPESVSGQIAESIRTYAQRCDAWLVLDQVDLADTGVITTQVKEAVEALARERLVIADSRRGLRGWNHVMAKMNLHELELTVGEKIQNRQAAIDALRETARIRSQVVLVTMAEGGVWAANALGELSHAPAWPLRGPIDVVGAGDAVSANLAMALSAKASLSEALELAMAAGSIVIHQLGTTGTASIDELRNLITGTLE